MKKIDCEELQRLNMLGYSDCSIARMSGSSRTSITSARHRMGLKPNYPPFGGENVDPLKAYKRATKRNKTHGKAYRQTHKEEAKAYRQTHKEEAKAHNKVYYQSHKEEIKAYRQTHKEEMKAYDRDSYQRKKKNKTPKIAYILCGTSPVGDDVVERKCWKCKRNLYPGADTEAEIRGKMPKAEIRYACLSCAREAYGKEIKKKIVAADSCDKLGIPKELLELIGKDMLERPPETIAG